MPRPQAKTAALADLANAGLAPRGLSREQAAAYVGVGVTLFDAMVDDGRMPRPKRLNARLVWDRLQLDRSFEAIPDENDDTDLSDDAWSVAV
jgi:predicted DNA-binding transcriptional regulator AlpA